MSSLLATIPTNRAIAAAVVELAARQAAVAPMAPLALWANGIGAWRSRPAIERQGACAHRARDDGHDPRQGAHGHLSGLRSDAASRRESSPMKVSR